MRVTFIGHAGLFVESKSSTMLVDPWLSGSCYWRSWWHFPPSPAPEESWLKPDYLYLTHHHFDHFHYPSLRRIDRSARVLIPRFGNDVMPRELRRLGFAHIVEMPHGKLVTLQGTLRAASFQYGFDDSTLVVDDGEEVLFDLNDCKIRPRDLERLRHRFGRPSLMVKSHSWAQGYPNCYSADEPKDLEILNKQDYVTDFIDSARALQPRLAVPFASMVCFLHPETWDRNGDVVTPIEVADAFARSPVPRTGLAMVKPGDTWESGKVFVSDVGDFYSARERWLERQRHDVLDRIEQSLAEEKRRELDPLAVADYFTRFLRALPWVARIVMKRPCVFEVRDRQTFLVLDWRRRRAVVTTELPDDYASLIVVPPAVLAQAVDDKIVHFIHISMRLRTHVRSGGISTDFALWTLLGLWELGYLPARRVMNPRFAGVSWRRRSEIGALATTALKGRGSMASRMTSRFMSSDQGDQGGQGGQGGQALT